jgi:hypothetical protein
MECLCRNEKRSALYPPAQQMAQAKISHALLHFTRFVAIESDIFVSTRTHAPKVARSCSGSARAEGAGKI